MLRKLIFVVLFLFSIALCGDLLTVLARGAHASGHSYKGHPFRTYKTHPRKSRSFPGRPFRGSSQRKVGT